MPEMPSETVSAVYHIVLCSRALTGAYENDIVIAEALFGSHGAWTVSRPRDIGRVLSCYQVAV